MDLNSKKGRLRSKGNYDERIVMGYRKNSRVRM